MVTERMDGTRRFVIGQGAVRGECVHLGEAWRAMLARRAYPTSIVALLGECLAASTLLTSTLKMLQPDGRLTLQIQGGKPVSLLVAECSSDLVVRGTAKFDSVALDDAGAELGDLARGATFAVTIDPGGDYDSYQSLVPVESASVAAALNEYMTRSEQIESHFVLAANQTSCAGFLVQRVPQQGGTSAKDADPDLWNRIRTLSSTLRPEELLEVDDTTLLHRLFHQEEVRLLPERPISFACRCSTEKVASVVRLLGADEVRGLLADRRTIEVDCDFCGQKFTLSAEEAWAALKDASP